MTNPTPLSPAAQAIWDAAWQLSPVNCESHEDRRRQQIAAALRAAADQVVPDDGPRPDMVYAGTRWEERERIRAALLAIADELEGSNA